MYKYAIILALLNLATCEERSHKKKNVDLFTVIDKHFSQSVPLGYHYSWPWGQLLKTALVFDVQEHFMDAQIIPDPEYFKVKLNTGQFRPSELTIKVKNGYLTVEGKHQEIYPNKMPLSNHFIQRFVLPPGTKQEEVKAVLNQIGVLIISAPKHEVPPPPPERVVPLEFDLPEPVEPGKWNISERIVISSSDSPLEQIETEATTHVGKIRKKELKTTTKTAKDNEVTKGSDGNGVDYALIEAEE